MDELTRKNLTRFYIQQVLFLIINGILLFSISGNLNWMWAWVYLIIYPLYTAINALILPKELLAERGKKKTNLKKWDVNFTRLSILPAIGVFIVAALDERYSWTKDKNLYFHISGLVFYLHGNVIVTWSMYSNRFFSTMVQIQSERGHRVATEGAYRIVRHPGYVGIILNTLATPFFLGSLWALVPAVLLTLLFIGRTYFEDNMLQLELENYSEYSQKVRYRLMPGIW